MKALTDLHLHERSRLFHQGTTPQRCPLSRINERVPSAALELPTYDMIHLCPLEVNQQGGANKEGGRGWVDAPTRLARVQAGRAL